METQIKRNVAIVVGHDQKAKGAFGCPPINESEYDYNLKVAKALQIKMNLCNANAKIFLRNGVGIEGAYKQVNAFSPACVIELHFNASLNGKAVGTEVLYCDKNSESEKLASLVQASVCSAFERKGNCRGIKMTHPHDRGDLNVHLSNAPSCLVEPFFGDNGEDAKLAVNNFDKYVSALQTALCDFLLSELDKVLGKI